MGTILIKAYQRVCTTSLIISVPINDYWQDAKKNNPYEVHKAQWSVGELEALGGRLLFKGEVVGVFQFPAVPREDSAAGISCEELLDLPHPQFIAYCEFCEKIFKLHACPECDTEHRLWLKHKPEKLRRKTFGLITPKKPQPVENYRVSGISCKKCKSTIKKVTCNHCDVKHDFSKLSLLTKDLPYCKPIISVKADDF